MKTNRKRRFGRRAAAWSAVIGLAASVRVGAQPQAAQPQAAQPSGQNAKGQNAKPRVTAPTRLESLEARLSKATFAGGEPVYLDITLLNRAAKPAAFLMLGPKLEFKIKRDGKLVVLTYRGKDESKGDKISYRVVPVGEKFAYRMMLSRWFDLSRAGIYTLTCTKYLRNEARDPGADLVGPLLSAQTVKFTVSDADFELNGANK